MLKRFLFVTTLIFTPLAAQASDLPAAKNQAKSTPVIVKAYDWSGVYVGANIGYAHTNLDASISDLAGSIAPVVFGDGGLPTSDKLNANELAGGLQAGVNYQINQFVYGVEADLNSINAKGNYSGSTTVVPFETISLSVENKLSWLSTVRGRVGIANDNLFIYGTGGLAIGSVDSATSAAYVGIISGTVSGSKSATLTGWTAGGGAEYAFSKNISAKIEYLYYDLGTVQYTVASDVYGSGATNAKNDGYLVRVGLNYHF